MHQLIYTSEATDGLTAEDLFRIVEQSARNNPSADITGFLVYHAGRFLQLIEGPLLGLESLIARLERDPRHHSLAIVSRLPVAERSFPGWRMKRVGTDGNALAELTAALREQGRSKPLPSAVREFLLSQARAA